MGKLPKYRLPIEIIEKPLKVYVNVRIQRDLLKFFDDQAETTGNSRTALIEGALEDYMAWVLANPKRRA